MFDEIDDANLDFQRKASTLKGDSLEKTFKEFVEWIIDPTFFNRRTIAVSKECKKIVELAERMYATETAMLWLSRSFKEASVAEKPAISAPHRIQMLSSITDLWNMHGADAEKARRLLANALLESPRTFPVITEDEMRDKIKEFHGFK